jgi:hypothetical protein
MKSYKTILNHIKPYKSHHFSPSEAMPSLHHSPRPRGPWPGAASEARTKSTATKAAEVNAEASKKIISWRGL